MKKNYITTFIILIFTSLIFSSCSKKPEYTRFDVSDYVTYLETPAEYTYGQVLAKAVDFKPLSKKDMGNLNNLIENDGDFLWLKIQFYIPENLKDKEIGLYIGYIRGADLLFMNNIGVRQYGDFPPNENSAGFIAQYFMFSENMLNRDGLNTILIRVWPDAFASIAEKIYISEKPAIYTAAESMTFFNSKITLNFAAVLLVIFFIYIFLYIVMKNYENRSVYLFFALLNFFTIFFEF